jgi:hypothetical protein
MICAAMNEVKILYLGAHPSLDAMVDRWPEDSIRDASRVAAIARKAVVDRR